VNKVWPAGATRVARALAWSLALLALLASVSMACGPSPEGSAAGDGDSVASPATPASAAADDGSAPPSGASDPARSVVLITIDTLRADALGFAGNDEVETPALDRLAAAGRVFTNAHAHNVVTLPSHTNILTGHFPYQHGVRNNGGFKLGPELPTLATVLHDAGFATGAVVGAFPLDGRFGLDRGFDLYDDDFDDSGGGNLFVYSQRSGDEVVARGLRWWKDHAGTRRFLWLHLFEPHAPYAPPAPFAGRFSSPYLGEVATVDHELAPLLGRFLDGEEEPTVIAVTADHGESLGEHGEGTHGMFAYEATLAVPLVLWGPGVESGRDARLAGHVDLMPSLLELLGVKAPDGLPGRSLVEPAGPEGGAERSLYFESLSPNLEYGAAPLRGVIRDGLKYIDLPVPELYDLRTDPDEKDNVIDRRRADARALRNLLPEESQWPPAAPKIGREEAARLQSLGYLGTSSHRKASYGPEDDPKNLVTLNHDLNRVASLYEAGRFDQALAVGEKILARRPSMTVAYSYMTKILLSRGETARAIDLLQRAEKAGAADDALRQQLGLTLVRAGRPAEALDALERIDPTAADPDTLSSIALAQSALGRHDEALKTLEPLMSRDPESPRLRETASFIAVQAGRFEQARRWALQALELDGERPDSWNNLGVASYNLDRKGEAVEAWKRAASLEPSNLDVLFNLGLVAAEIGDGQTARTALRRFLAAAPPNRLQAERARARQILSSLAP